MSTGIALGELQSVIAARAQLVEVLPEESYRKAHLPGAVNIPLKQLDADSVSVLDRERPVVVYCWDSL